MDYKTYRETYAGTLQEDEFIRAFRRARSFIRYATFDRADEIEPDTLEMLTVDLVEQIGSCERAGGVASSRTIGSEFVSFKVSEDETHDSRLYETVYQYLAGTGLLYQGVYPN